MADISRTVKQPNREPKVVVKTASFTVKASDSDKTFYLNSTTAITATLPKVTKANDGTKVTFVVGALAGASDHRVTPATGDFIHFAAAGTAAATVSQSLVFSNATDNVGQCVTLVACLQLVGWVPVALNTTASLAKA